MDETSRFFPPLCRLQISLGLGGTAVGKQGRHGNSKPQELGRHSGKIEHASVRTDTWANISKTVPEEGGIC